MTTNSTSDSYRIPKCKMTILEGLHFHPLDYSTPWRLQQAWLGKEQENFQAGSVSLAWQADSLWVSALLPDNEIFSASTADSQPHWIQGDVFEIFIRRETSPVYIELHVTPNGHQLHLRWPQGGIEKIGTKQAELEEFMNEPRAFQAEVKKASDVSMWSAFVKIPASIVPDGTPFFPGEKMLLSFSRYDGDKNGMNAVLSSTSPHTQPSFHRQEEWRKVILD